MSKRKFEASERSDRLMRQIIEQSTRGARTADVRKFAKRSLNTLQRSTGTR
jgi:hypothetical protein